MLLSLHQLVSPLFSPGHRLAAALLLLTSATNLLAQSWRMVGPPKARSGHAMAYDSGRGCTVLFGGMWSEPSSGGMTVPQTKTLGDTWEFVSTTGLWRWRHVAAAPPPRWDHSMAYDSQRARTVLFGGFRFGAGWNAETWEYDGAAGQWHLVATAASPPAGSFGSGAMVYDAPRQRCILFTGQTTWEYDGVNWLSVATVGTPPPRWSHSMAYDPQRARTVLFGGGSSSGALQDTWEYNGSTATWTVVGVAFAPPGRVGHVLAYDPVRQRCVLVGGSSGSGPLQDTWEFDGVVGAWTLVQPFPSLPQGLVGSAGAFDGQRNALVSFGGVAGISAGGVTSSFVVGYTLEYRDPNSGWTVSATQPVPPSSYGVPFEFDPKQRVSVLFASNPLGTSTAWLFSAVGQRWQSLPTSMWTPPGLVDAGTGYANALGRLVACAGQGMLGLWVFEPPTLLWQPLAVAGATPPARDAHAVAYDRDRGRLVLFGGQAAGTLFQDTWEFDFATAQWIQRLPTNAPTGRRNHRMSFAASTGRVVLFGGDGAGGDLGDTWTYDVAGVNWTQRSSSPAPSPRSRHAMTYDQSRGRVVLFGGQASGLLLDDMWSFDPGTSTWSPVPLSPRPEPRFGHSLAYDERTGEVVMFGGDDGSEYFADTWLLELDAVAHWVSIGSGCAGSAGASRLFAAAGSAPALGTTFQLGLDTLPTAPGLGALALGTEWGHILGQPLPTDLGQIGLAGCRMWLDPTVLLPFAYTGSQASVAIVIPNVPALAGAHLAAQALVAEPTGSSAWASLSNAGLATLR